MLWSSCSLVQIYTVLLSLCFVHLYVCVSDRHLRLRVHGTSWQSEEQVRAARRLPVRHAVGGGRQRQHFQSGGGAGQDSGCEVLCSQRAVPQG